MTTSVVSAVRSVNEPDVDEFGITVGRPWHRGAMADTQLTQYFVAASMDGFIATEDDDLSWLLQFDGVDEAQDANPYDAFIADVGVLAMGATTYEWVQRHDEGWAYGDRPTWVFSHRELHPIDGATLRFARGDVTSEHRRMLAQADGKNVWVVGGGDLAGQFMDAGLLDEIWLTVTPVTLGRGAPLLPRRHPNPMTLISAVPAPNGTFVHLRYRLH
jgi:dihydrofolate reductase